MEIIKEIKDDFDMDLIADSGQCFRWDKIKDDTYRVIHREDCLYISRIDENSYLLQCDEDTVAGWEEYLDLDEDYRAIRARIDGSRDPFLDRAAEDQKGIRILRQDPWEMLITFIISQNKNIPASMVITWNTLLPITRL